ncbi:MAG: putative zinc-binding metallopeptidase [Gammaproteobacteria bacterium]|nr:putative zinc-binding metallopeptidase [Pseudomonadales bacterium]MCP5345476.1 putative zinc-binding metallopeptidase [Pseudomonadales bacterium]
MKNFECACGQTVYFENDYCLSCLRRLAYDPLQNRILTLTVFNPRTGSGTDTEGNKVRLCKNDIDYGVCNWLVTTTDNDFCLSCSLNHMIPNLLAPDRRDWWARMEQAKRKLLYTLLTVGLPVVNKENDPEGGLAFEFIEDKSSNPNVENELVLTGHMNGLITVNIAEADSVKREQARQSLGESYRTLLGHFRHESGHYYFWKLINNDQSRAGFRDLFGDETADYQQAMDNYYANRDSMTRDPRMISHYAQSHPLEDWAECWAHYLHMIDTLETAEAFNIRNSQGDADRSTIDSMLARWGDLTLMLNALNRSMGMGDAYPFILSDLTLRKIRFVHSLVNPS